MKRIMLYAGLLCLLFIFAGCTVEPVTPPTCNTNCVFPIETITANTSKTFDQSVLTKLSEAVYKESQSNACQRGDSWGIAGVGVKPCGGPAGYIAYKKYNEECFLKVLARFNEQSQVYNIKYQLISTCEVPPAPKAVVCEDGKPVFVY